MIWRGLGIFVFGLHLSLSLTNQSNRTVLPRKVRLVGRNVVRACHDYNSQLGPRYRPKLFNTTKNNHVQLIVIFCCVGSNHGSGKKHIATYLVIPMFADLVIKYRISDFSH
jgi:hypothetical protein